MPRHHLDQRLPDMVQSLAASIEASPALRHLNRVHLPDHQRIVLVTDLLRTVLFPGYFPTLGRKGPVSPLTLDNLHDRLAESVKEIIDILYDQVRWCLRYRENLPANANLDDECRECDAEAARIVDAFMARLPAVRELLGSDVQAAFDGDPAARSTDETIYCYPGLHAITVQRLAHELYVLNVPLMPRIMTEHAHSLTGIDIHPGAVLGPSLMIDHGTGVVIGETTEIGRNVKIYQGVTLGALAPAYGQVLRGKKRHPTIGDDVVLYAGATILGGDTVIGKGSVIGGNVFITNSVPANHQVTADPPTLKVRPRKVRATAAGDMPLLDFQI